MKILDFLQQAIKSNASDLHISPDMQPIIRVDGDLLPINNSPTLTAEQTKNLVYEIMTQNQIKEFEKTLELDFACIINDLAGFRVNAYHEVDGVASAFRVIPAVVPTLDELDFPAVFKELLNLPNGLIIVTGPTGSGKSTTLAAMINHINENFAKHIITIEDPIEFLHTNKKCLINQRQLHRDTKSFKKALRAALREDPDVILLGEMRDLETIRLALTAAETGHLVMTTLHTSSAPRTVSRIVDVFAAEEKLIVRNMLSESLQAVITQTLIKKVGGGRIPAFEIMLGVPAIRNLIRENQIAQMYSSIQTGSNKGMCTLDQYLSNLLAKNLITKEQAYDVAANRELFKL